jgi:hypothetical protein
LLSLALWLQVVQPPVQLAVNHQIVQKMKALETIANNHVKIMKSQKILKISHRLVPVALPSLNAKTVGEIAQNHGVLSVQIQ